MGDIQGERFHGIDRPILIAALSYAVIDVLGSATSVLDVFQGSVFSMRVEWWSLAAFYGIAFGYPRVIDWLMDRRALLWGSGALCGGGLVFSALSLFEGTPLAMTMDIATQAMLALFTSCFFLGWMNTFSRMRVSEVVRAIALSFVVGALFAGLCLFEGLSFLLTVATCASPVLGVWGFLSVAEELQLREGADGNSPGNSDNLGSAIHLVCALVLVEFAAVSVTSLGDHGSYGLNLAGGALFAIILIISIARGSLGKAFQVGLTVAVLSIAAGAFCLFLPSLSSFIAAEPLAYAGFALFSIISCSVLCSLGGAASPLTTRLFSAMQLGNTMAFLGAKFLCAYATPRFGVTLLATGAVVLAVAALAILTLDRGFHSLWGLGASNGGDKESATFDQVSLEARCAEMGRCYDLTLREQDVLKELALRKTAVQIACELFISESTVKTHISHIYRKCGVRKKTQLLDLVFSRTRDE